MGDHYLPQYYLKGFTESGDSDFLYRYERGHKHYLRTKVKNVAQETGFYSRSMESYLANEIENSANPAIKKLRELQQIDANERRALTRYIVTMIKRVPQNKEQARQWLKEISDPYLLQLENDIQNILLTNSSKKDIAEKRLGEIKQIREQKRIKPEQIWNPTIPPEQTPTVSLAVEAMTWKYMVSRDDVFVTSDNPVFFFREIGVGNERSELTFPISSKIILWATWESKYKGGFHKVRDRNIREFNRRVASSVKRYAFYSQGTAWVSKLISRKSYKLSYLVQNGKLPNELLKLIAQLEE